MVTEKLGYRTVVRKLSRGGRVMIRYDRKQELEDILKKLGVENPNEY